MKIQLEQGAMKSPAVSIQLTGDEVATAIDAWLVAHGVHVSGPRTVFVNNELCVTGEVYVDPSGFVIKGGKKYGGSTSRNGRFPKLGNLTTQAGQP